MLIEEDKMPKSPRKKVNSSDSEQQESSENQRFSTKFVGLPYQKIFLYHSFLLLDVQV
jgi:hypothetical protein